MWEAMICCHGVRTKEKLKSGLLLWSEEEGRIKIKNKDCSEASTQQCCKKSNRHLVGDIVLLCSRYHPSSILQWQTLFIGFLFFSPFDKTTILTLAMITSN
jgi:hypothetical protein